MVRHRGSRENFISLRRYESSCLEGGGSGRTPVFACPICGEKITTEINYLAVTLR
jgi:hypothetical protein